MKCPFCNKDNVEFITGTRGTIVSCSCGLSSKLFRNYIDAEKWFFTRQGKSAKLPVIEVGEEAIKKPVR